MCISKKYQYNKEYNESNMEPENHSETAIVPNIYTKHLRFVLLSFIAICGISISIFYYLNNKKSAPIKQELTTIATLSTTTTGVFIPKKIEFGTSTPDGFPTNIPIEKGATFSQSYSLDYQVQKQLTIAFPSTKTIKENISLYSDYLTKQNWNISNIYASTTLASLYATKEGGNLNVTLSNITIGTSTKLLVSISFFDSISTKEADNRRASQEIRKYNYAQLQIDAIVKSGDESECDVLKNPIYQLKCHNSFIVK